MSIKIISYDLGGPETSESYRNLINYIESLGDTFKPLESFFFVNTYKTCEEIRNGAARYLDDNDKIIVTDYSHISAWSGLPPNTLDWLRSR